jgi:uncharacterized membrane protein YqaE (UPF0057 family)
MISASSFAFDSKFVAAPLAANAEVAQIDPELAKLNVEKFINLTPSEYQKMTGKKLGLKKTLAMKAAQKKLKKELPASPDDLSKELYIVLAIFISFVAVGIASDWEGSDWIINLVLSLLCWLPGVIHALMKMKNYYN